MKEKETILSNCIITSVNVAGSLMFTTHKLCMWLLFLCISSIENSLNHFKQEKCSFVNKMIVHVTRIFANIEPIENPSEKIIIFSSTRSSLICNSFFFAININAKNVDVELKASIKCTMQLITSVQLDWTELFYKSQMYLIDSHFILMYSIIIYAWNKVIKLWMNRK